MTEGVFLQPIRRTNIVDDIIDRFKQALISGEFQPGQRLPSEPELGEILGVGRSTLREAVKILAAMGAVEVRRGDGTYISEGVSPGVIDPLLFAVLVEPKNAPDLHEFRLLIEIGNNRLAAQKADEEDFARLEALIDGMQSYVDDGGHDNDVLAEMDLAFHEAILAATKNPVVIKVGSLLNRMFYDSLRQANATTEGVEWTLARHRRIVEVLRTQDPVRIEQVITASLGGIKRSAESGPRVDLAQ